MKVLKVIGIVLVSIVVLFLIVTALLPADYRVERSIVINAPASTVYEEVRYFKNFNNWSPFYSLDTTAKIEITGPDGEVGAVYSWSSKKDDVGSGSMTRVSQEQNKSLISDLRFEGISTTSKAGYTFEEVQGGTKVVWYSSGSLPFMFRFFGLMMDGSLGKMFDKGLQKMKAHVESMPPPAQVEPPQTIAE